MTTGHAEVVSTVVSLYSSQTIAVDLGIASTAMVLYDTILSLHREVQYVWRERRKWHQRVLYVLTRHMFTILLLLEEQTINPISDQNCQILVWSSSLAGFSSILGPTIFTIWRAYALSGKNKVVGGAMSLAGIVMIFYNAIVFLVITPINLPPPENCTSSSRLDASYNTPLNIIAIVSSTVGLSLVTIITWHKTRCSIRRSAVDFPRQRPTLPRVMFEYGMIYFCVLLTLNLANVVLLLSSLTQLGQTFTTYVGNFNTTFTSILTSRLLLDIYEIEARLPRGGASATGSFSINVQVNSAEPGESLEFVTSYGGRAHSGPFSEDRDDDAIGLEEEGEETSSVPADGAIREETAFSRRSLSGRTPPQETKGKARALAK